MEFETFFLGGTLLTVVANLYSSVGHGGASGKIAVLVLFGSAHDIIRPAPLSFPVRAASEAA